MPTLAELAEKFYPLDPEALHRARRSVILEICLSLKRELLSLFDKLSTITVSSTTPHACLTPKSLSLRQLRNAVFSFLSEFRDSAAAQLAFNYYQQAVCLTDKYSALIALANMQHPQRQQALDAFYEHAAGNHKTTATLSNSVSVCLPLSPPVSPCLLLYFSVSLCPLLSPFVCCCLLLSSFVFCCLLLSPFVPFCLPLSPSVSLCLPLYLSVSFCLLLSPFVSFYLFLSPFSLPVSFSLLIELFICYKSNNILLYWWGCCDCVLREEETAERLAQCTGRSRSSSAD